MKLIDIVKSGYCIGCGACCSVRASGLEMGFDEYGQYQPNLSEAKPLPPAVHEEALKICPFSDAGPNEDEIGRDLYAKDNKHNAMLGYHSEMYIGHVRTKGFREIATSGGLITWTLCKLLERGEIDGVIHVKPVSTPPDGVLFRYGISRTVGEVKGGAKSRYYPIETSEVIEMVRRTPGRYAFVGLPCFVKAIRRLCRVDPVFGSSIRFTIGLVCGHLKSRAFADLFGWQAGISPGHLERVDFRVKRKDGDSQDYAVLVAGGGKEVVRKALSYFGTNWGYNLFRNSACDYCDDVFAEAADLTVGDAWLPEFRRDPGGNSVLVIRNQALRMIIQEAVESGELALVTADEERVIGTQSGGFRDRREALSYRLWMDIKAGRPVPKKRVSPTKGEFPFYRRLIYRNRITLRRKSHIEWSRAVQLGSLRYFIISMAPWMLLNNMLYKYPAFLRSMLPWLFPKKR